VDAGYTSKQAVIILYGLSAVSALVAVLIAVQNMKATFVVFFFFIILLMMLFIYRKRT
jgi:hypothetical protein